MGILAMIRVFIVQTLAAVYAHVAWDFYNDVRQQGVDRSKLIADTVLLCGIRSVCNQSAIPFPVLPETERRLSSCVLCKCDVDCWSRGDCCVDLPYLYLTSSCQSTELILNGSTANISSKFNFKMIASCPETNLYDEVNEQCDGFRNEGSFLDNDIQTPVASLNTHITYRNKYCAKCHGDHDVIRWDRFAECVTTTFDINTISTVKELKNALSDYNCSLVHVFPSILPHIPIKPCVSNYDDHVISTCNKTGLWMDYDPSIEWACKNFQPGDIFFEHFRNIFCYMCNPSIATVYHDVIVDRCNMTGKWRRYERSLEEGCLNLPSIQRLRPYKNAYCMLCNGRDTFSNFMASSIGNLDFEISTFSNRSIAIIQFSETSLLNLLENIVTDWERGMYEFDIGVKTAKSDFDNRKQTNNVSSSICIMFNILKEIRLICGENSFCISDDPDGYSNGSERSHAEMNSSFSESPCFLCDCSGICSYYRTSCVDLLLNKNPYDCISNEIIPSVRDQHTSSESEFIAISTCKNISQNMCHHQSFSNLTGILPRISDESVIFKNILRSYYQDFKDNLQPLDIKITCPILLEPTMFLSFSSLLKTALERKCEVLVASARHDCCREQHLMVSKCNTTGGRKHYDQNVKNMCELGEQFSICGLSSITYEKKNDKNIFYLCNHNISKQSVIRHCNVTGHWNVYNPVTEQACEQGPEHVIWYPYKNRFCNRCNEKMYGISLLSGILGIINPTYRSLFAFKLPSWIDFRKQESTCKDGMYDSYKMVCTNEYCPAGRQLKNGSCVIILEETKNLRYSITFPLVCISDHVTYYVNLQVLLRTISETIMNKLRALDSEMEIKYSNTWTNKSCKERKISRKTTFINQIPTIFFHANISIRYTSKRTALEGALLGFRKTNFQLEYYGANLTFGTIQFSMTHDSKNNHPCRRTSTAFGSNDFESFIISNVTKNENKLEYRPVSNFLECVMIELSKNQYVYNKQTETIVLKNTKHILERHDVEFQADGSIRVCRDHVNQGALVYRISTIPALPYQASLMASIYNIFSYVCTVISIICLVITFVTYCLFKTLRSLPGKNNMCLVLCLLCAQTLLQFGLWQSQHPIICQVIAIGIHFFWMATFSSMNVCSIHMYRVFCSNAFAIFTDGDSKRFLMWYIAYICTVPFVCILINITFNSSLSNGQDIGYGGERCFLNNQYSILFTFIIPSMIIFISNAVLFAICFHKIRFSPSIPSNSRDKRNFFIYVKLSTITGVAWIFQITDGLLELSVFSFFVTFVNALQGMFIFASYICNRRVLKLYMNNCDRRRKPKEPQKRITCHPTQPRTEQTYL
ncbi:hypothetical protein ACJMK2_024084 [Sinanodonta woodiana]|uniref:G-protein coupled receptors family 2 profile 2 domain-containing protein n=1 Tax=Sinanodonta woodiana TaxID=1069815 RepID=A0ABD3T693_SINWO